jgi:hypothetical protein
VSEQASLKERKMQLRQNGTRPAPEKGRESGSGMLMAVFVLFLVTSLGVALLFLSRTEVQLSQADGRSKVAYFYSEAGLEKARELTHFANFISSDKQYFTDEFPLVAGADGALDFDVTNLTATFDSDGNLTGLTGYDDDRPALPLAVIDTGWHAAFLTNDPAEAGGIHDMTDTNKKAMITGIGAGPHRSLEITQAIVEKIDLYPIPPATITILGEPGCGASCAQFWGGTSTPKRYLGDDSNPVCPGGDPSLWVPVVGVIGGASNASAQGGVIKPGSFFTGPHSGTDTVTDLTTDPSLDPLWTDCNLLVDLAAEVLAAADVVGNSSTPNADLGTTADPKVVYIDGDYVVGPSVDSGGLLLVTGELQFHGNADWQGLILALGKGDFIRFGSGNGDIAGSIVVADIAGPDRVLFTGDDCAGQDNVIGTADDGIAQSSYLVTGGGTGRTAYCSAYLIQWQAARPLEIISFLQR